MSTPLPFVMSPPVARDAALGWVEEQKEAIQAALDVHGGVLFRGLPMQGPRDLERFIELTAGSALPYVERSSPRTRVDGNIYTSTDYPASESIFIHNEQSYNQQFPLRIYFCCLQASRTGGETPVCDCRRVYERLSAQLLDRFSDGYLYARNFGGGLGLSWREAFQTQDRAEVEAYCARQRIRCEWRSGDRLRTLQPRRVVARHPRTGERVWFNHCTFFHVSTLPPLLQQALRLQNQSDLPNQTYFADGSEIDAATLDELREAYHAETRTFPWQPGDVLMLDNMMVAHGRRPFSGQRRVVVGMADPCSWDSV